MKLDDDEMALLRHALKSYIDECGAELEAVSGGLQCPRCRGDHGVLGVLGDLGVDATASEDELIEFCADNMARFKRPKKVVFGELPKTATGKIQKNVLRERTKEL